jgi:uroporphyrinogen-III decarboxylase
MPTLSYVWTDAHTQPAETAARVRFDTEAMPSVSATPQQSQYIAQLRVTIEQANQTYTVIETDIPVEVAESR